MAIAFLKYEDSTENTRLFRFDLGRNRYYAYVVGGKDSFTRNGIRLIEDPHFSSELLGPLPEGMDGRGELEVPEGHFDRENCCVQLFSYRNRRREGPAVSKILSVPLGDLVGEDELPAINFNRRVRAVNSYASAYSMPDDTRAYTAPRIKHVRAKLRRRPLSEAKLFGLDAGTLGSIGNALLSALPVVMPLIAPNSPRSAETTSSGGGSGLQGALDGIIRAIMQAGGATAAPAATPTTPAPAAAPVAVAPVSPSSLSFQSSRMSQAMIAPALIAALPALMPLLQQVLSPQTIQGVLQTADPNRLIGTVANAVQNLGQLGMQIQGQEMQHLERLNPGVDDPALMNLLGQMSVNLREASAKGKFRRVQSVKLNFADIPTVTVDGRQVVACKVGADWAFPMSLDTLKSVPPGTLRVTIKNATTLKVIAEDRIKTPPLSEGMIGVVNRVPADRLTGVRAGDDYLICVDLTWKNKKGERIGAHMSQLITAIDEFTFDAIEEAGETIPLNDIDKHRDFWHQAWSQDFSREIARIELECMYYLLLQPDEVTNAQIETSTKTSEKGLRRRESRLESGLLMSPNRLNELLRQISDHPELSEKELAALAQPSFARHIRLGARTSVKFSGRPGQTAALWVFPEVKVKEVLLQQASEVNDNGTVVRMEPHMVHFPVPVLVHFVGVRST